MISNSELRCEIRRAGVACLELLRELQALRLGIMIGVTQEVRPQLEALRTGLVRDIVTALSPKKTHHRPDLRKQAIAKLIQENPKIANWEICRAMDKLAVRSPYYAPPPSWDCRSWHDAYHRVNNRVHSYIGSVRQTLRLGNLDLSRL